MGRFIPSRLVAVRYYGASYGGSMPASPGREDCRLLKKEGIDAQVRGVFRGSSSLVVPEAQYERSNEILSTVPDLFAEHDIAPRCPQCRAEHPYSRPPSAVLLLVAAVIPAGVTLAYGYANTAGIIMVATAAVATGIQFLRPQFQCRKCGTLYGATNAPAGRR